MGDDLKSLGQFSTNRIAIAKKISTKVINSSPPPPFQDTRGSHFHRLSSEEVVNQKKLSLFNVAQDDSSPDKNEILKLLNIKNAHISFAPRIFPGHPEWNEAISLSNCTSPKQGRIQVVSGMPIRDSSIVVSLCQLQRLPDQSWMAKAHQDHGGELR